jgi:hypothetical protein
MSKKLLIVGGIVISLIMAIVLWPTNNSSVGSVQQGSEYKYKNLTTITGSSTNATQLKVGPGTLGQVVFSTTSAQSFTLYSVASAANFASTTLSTKIITFATGTVAGTYNFDTSYVKGIAVQADVTPTKEIVISYR